MNKCGIYRITSPSGKVYIGQAVNIKRRFSQYRDPNRNKKHPKLNNSFLKYGIESHVFEVIEECDITLLDEKERYWQDHYDVLNPVKGLNLTLTKTSSKRYIHSDITRKKISQKKTGRKGKPHSDAVKKNMSIIKIGDKNPFHGKNHTNDTRIRMSKNRIKRLQKGVIDN